MPRRAVLLDCLGTLLELEPPGPRLRRELARRGVDVSASAAEGAFRAEIGYYLDHHLDGRDRESLARLRNACAAVTAEALGLGRERLAVVRAALLAAISFVPRSAACKRRCARCARRDFGSSWRATGTARSLACWRTRDSGRWWTASSRRPRWA